MPFLNLDGGSGSDHIVERLVLERKRRAAKSIGFDNVDVDEAILQAAVVLFRDRQQQQQQQQYQQQNYKPYQRGFTIDSGRKTILQSLPKQPSPTSNNNNNNGNGNNNNNNNNNVYVKLEKLCISNCPANPFLEYLIEAAMGMDLFQEFELQGNMEEQEEEEEQAQLAAQSAAEQAAAAEPEVAAAVAPARRNDRNENNNNNNTCDQQNPDDDDRDEEMGNNNDDDDEDDENDENTPPPPSASPQSSSNIFALDALGFRMRFSRRLRKLELMNLPITRDHAESLMYGIETNVTTGTGCRLHTLVMEGVRFVDDDDDDDDDDDENDENDNDDNDEENTNNNNNNNEEEDTAASTITPGDGTIVIKELCEGFPNNRTLKTIELQRCRLTDAQIALIIDSLARHPTITHLNLSENYCRTLGLEALDRMLVSPLPTATNGDDSNGSNNSNNNNKNRPQHHHFCRIESLDLSYQFTSEETYGTGEHIQLDIMTRNCTTKDADKRIYPNLRKLVLQGNQIYDSDMKDLAFLIRHRFPRLEELDLRFNEITTEGLEAFANYSDPNNDNYLTSNSNSNNGSTNNNNTSSSSKKYKDHFPPASSRLRTIRLTNNPLVMTNQTSIVILKLLKLYPELQLIQSNLEWEDGTPIAKYIQHMMDINRAGRVLLLTGSSVFNCSDIDSDSDSDSTRRLSGSSNVSSSATDMHYTHEHQGIPSSSSALPPPEEEKRLRQQRQQQLRRPIPLGAWSLVLARLTRKARYPHYIPKKNSLNGMYYLVRHGPIIVEQMASRINNSNNKNNSNSKSNGGAKSSSDTKCNKNSNEHREQQDRKRKWGDPALGGYETLADFLRCELGAKA